MIEQFADRVAVMYLGRIIESGTIAPVFQEPAHQYTAASRSVTPSHHAAARRDRVTLRGKIADVASPPPGCVVHPRCPAASEVCDEQKPPTVSSVSGEVFCHPLVEHPGRSVSS